MVGGTDRPIPPVLTTLQIKSAKPAERAYKLADTGGLFVLVQPNGSKLWRYKFRRGGIEGKQSFGAFPEIGLAEARGLHGDSRKLVAQGINPVQAKQELRVVQAQEQLERERGGPDSGDVVDAPDAEVVEVIVGRGAREVQHRGGDFAAVVENVGEIDPRFGE